MSPDGSLLCTVQPEVASTRCQQHLLTERISVEPREFEGPPEDLATAAQPAQTSALLLPGQRQPGLPLCAWQPPLQ